MKTQKKICALLVILAVSSSFGIFAQQDDKKKPKVPIVDKRDDRQDRSKENRDDKKQGKKPNEE